MPFSDGLSAVPRLTRDKRRAPVARRRSGAWGSQQHAPSKEHTMSTLLGIPFWAGVIVGVIVTLLVVAITG